MDYLILLVVIGGLIYFAYTKYIKAKNKSKPANSAPPPHPDGSEDQVPRGGKE